EYRAPRGAVPRRVSRTGADGPRGVADPPRGRGGAPGAPGRGGTVPGAVPAGAGREPVPVRPCEGHRLRVLAHGPAPVHGEALGPSARPGGPAGGPAPTRG